jgi:hypothetical protein
VLLARPACRMLPGPAVQLAPRGAAVLREEREATVEE